MTTAPSTFTMSEALMHILRSRTMLFAIALAVHG
jgi:hypothetical protein